MNPCTSRYKSTGAIQCATETVWVAFALFTSKCIRGPRAKHVLCRANEPSYCCFAAHPVTFYTQLGADVPNSKEYRFYSPVFHLCFIRCPAHLFFVPIQRTGTYTWKTCQYYQSIQLAPCGHTDGRRHPFATGKHT